MHDKNKFIIIAVVIVLCILGICYYAKDFTTNNNKTTNNVEKKNVNIKEDKKTFDVTKVDGQIGKDKVQSVKQCTNMLGENDKKLPIVIRNDEIFITDNKGSEQVIRKLPSGTAIDVACGDKNVISWIEGGSKPSGDQEFRYRSIYCYDMRDKSITKVAEDKFENDQNDVCLNSLQIGECLRVHDDKVYYAATSVKEEKCLRKVYMYNPADKKSTEVYTDNNTGSRLADDIGIFDIDYDKGYLFYVKEVEKKDDGTNQKCLIMVNMKKKSNNKKVLALSDNDINVSIKYPYAAFFLNKKVHLYNIEKGFDEAGIKCDYPLLYGIDVTEDKLIFANTKVYCFSIKNKKLYSFEESEKGSGSGYFSSIRGDNVCWSSDGSVYYINLKDTN